MGEIKLKSEFKYIDYKYDEYNFSFISDNGLFSKNEINIASKLLVETYIKNGKMNIKLLDIGCGYGFIGIVLSKVMNCNVTMSDINDRALHISKMNIERNKVDNIKLIKSNIYDNINEKYDVIITNPPMNEGKVIVREFLDGIDYLEKDGSLWFVIHKNQGAKSMIKYLKSKYSVNIIDKYKDFFIIFLKRIDTK